VNRQSSTSEIDIVSLQHGYSRQCHTIGYLSETAAVLVSIVVMCVCRQSELVNVGVAYCHSEKERCALDLDPGTNYYQPAGVGKGKGKVSVHTV